MKYILLIIICETLWGCGDTLKEQPSSKYQMQAPLPKYHESISKFESCQDLASHQLDVKNFKLREEQKYSNWLESQPQPQPLADSNYVAGGSILESGTEDQQVDGINEGNKVISLNNKIYVSRANSIDVVVAHPRQNRIDYFQSIQLHHLSFPRMILTNSYLIAYGADPSQPERSQIQVFKINPTGRLSPYNSLSLEGLILGARGTDSQFTLVTRQSQIDVTSMSEDQCRNTFSNQIDDLSTSMTNILQMDLSSNSINSKMTSVLGSTDTFYMSQNYLYLVQTELNWFWFDERLYGNQDLDRSLIKKISINDESYPQLKSSGWIEGKVNNSWSLHEIDLNSIAMATTQFYPEKSNHFYILDIDLQAPQRLNVASGVFNFAPTEDIRSVRFQKDLAYVVTFKKTDPLFIIEFANKLQPRIVSELKAPGFSTHLVPFSEDTMIGVGYGAIDHGSYALFDGVQLSQVNINDPNRPWLEQQIQLGQRGSFSDSTHDHKALFLDREQHQVGLPIVEFDFFEQNPSWHHQPHLIRSGFAIYGVNAALEETHFISHKDWIPQKCKDQIQPIYWWQHEQESLDVQRMVKLTDGKYLSISRFGTSLHDQDFQSIAKVLFNHSQQQCPTNGLYYPQ